MSTESVMPSNHRIFCHPLLLPPSIFPSIRVFSNESALCMRWPKYWSFSFSISPFNKYSGLISFRIDLLDLLAVQGILKSLLQHHSSKASVLQCSAFYPWVDGCKEMVRNRDPHRKHTVVIHDVFFLIFQFIPREFPDIKFFFSFKASTRIW